MNIREAAAELDTTPKALRRLLRSMNGGAVVGIGGSYDLTPGQVKALRLKVKKNTRPQRVDDAGVNIPHTNGFDPQLLGSMKKNPVLRAEVLKQRAERRASLMARLHDPDVAAFSAAQRRKELAAAEKAALTAGQFM